MPSQTSVQPPSGGCVLKLVLKTMVRRAKSAAAFGRLCVETSLLIGVVYTGVGSRLRAAVC